jgi:hypothetical protein
MSTKLNAEELAENRWDNPCSQFGAGRILGYADAIREVAQPLADEREELREALELARQGLDHLAAQLITKDETFFLSESGKPWEAMKLAHHLLNEKYPKP